MYAFIILLGPSAEYPGKQLCGEEPVTLGLPDGEGEVLGSLRKYVDLALNGIIIENGRSTCGSFNRSLSERTFGYMFKLFSI